MSEKINLSDRIINLMAEYSSNIQKTIIQNVEDIDKKKDI